MKIMTMVVGPIEENCYIVYDEVSKDAIIIDPGAEANRLIEAIKTHNLNLHMIVNTHAHFDHVGAIAELQERFGCPFYLHKADQEWLEPPLCHMFKKTDPSSIKVNGTIKDQDELTLGTLSFKVIHTPGHTKGGCVIYFEKEQKAFTGDTLFKGTVGRTDLHGGSYEAILDSVQNKMSSLPDECVVYPGHGPSTTMGFERIHNPYFRA